MEDDDEVAAAISHHHSQSETPFSSLLPIVVFRDDDDDEEEPDDDLLHRPLKSLGLDLPDDPGGSSSDGGGGPAAIDPSSATGHHPRPLYIDPEPHISSQFYTFNRESHALMVRCILERRLATPDEIRHATPRSVLRSWRSVWKDRNEDTAYLTAWKRIQDKLNAHLDLQGHHLLYFKNNSSQFVSHIDQWQDIVTSFHGDADLKHLGLKETIDRIKQVWTVGAKFYGIPESFIRVCVSTCPVCNGGHPGSSNAARSKRKRFEYTESFEVPAKDVQHRLQQLAAEHKVVLCIRQKYIRYKPFMAEVKDYACHRAGEPTSANSKKSKMLKREPYASKRCGCGFRIRAIVPIANYNEKDKTFVYQEEGQAVFKLFAVHTGHEPGPLDGNARIIHRLVGHKGSFDRDPVVYGINEDVEPESYISLLGKEDIDDLQLSVLHQVQELKAEAGMLEGKIMKVPRVLLGSLARELSDILHRVRNTSESLHFDKPQHSEEVMAVEDEELGHWEAHHDGHDSIYDKDTGLIEEEETDFGRTLEGVEQWDRMRDECQSSKLLMREGCKPDKWLMKDCEEFDDKRILACGTEEEDLKLVKPLRLDGTIVSDPTLVGIQVDGFYHDGAKWFDTPCGLDPGPDTGDGEYRHGGMV